MKIFLIVAILALLQLTACGNENNDTNETIRPVDAWSPFVQVVPPGNIWDVQDTVEYPPTVSATRQPTSRQEKIASEIVKLYSFLAPGQTLGGWIPDIHYPDYFGGLGWSYDFEYMIVLIVEGMDEEATEFLTFLDDFQTIKIRYSLHSFSELTNMQRKLWYFPIYPKLWWSRIDTISSSVIVYLFSYTDEEKEFFRNVVSDSPIISFVCMIEAHGEYALVLPVLGSHLPANQMEGVTMSAFAKDTQVYVIAINKEPGLTDTIAYHYILETYMSGRWIRIYEHSLLTTSAIGLLESGTSYFTISTEHFTRQFYGPFRVSVYIEQANPTRWHRLTYIFTYGG